MGLVCPLVLCIEGGRGIKRQGQKAREKRERDINQLNVCNVGLVCPFVRCIEGGRGREREREKV